MCRENSLQEEQEKEPTTFSITNRTFQLQSLKQRTIIIRFVQVFSKRWTMLKSLTFLVCSAATVTDFYFTTEQLKTETLKAKLL